MSPICNFAFFFFFFCCKIIYSKIYLNKFKLHHLYMNLYLFVWINLYNNNNIEGVDIISIKKCYKDRNLSEEWKPKSKITNLYSAKTWCLFPVKVLNRVRIYRVSQKKVWFAVPGAKLFLFLCNSPVWVFSIFFENL